MSKRAIPLSHRLAVYLSLAEIGLGGILHALKIPFTGYILSLHQIFCLSRAQLQSKDQSIHLPIIISSVAAILKALTPMGKRLTPFLAIITQGILFNFGTIILGRNFFGNCLGAMLSSTWGFIQPLIIAYIIFGSHFFNGLDIFQQFCVDKLPWINFYIFIGILVALKAVIATVIVIITYSYSEKKWQGYENILLTLSFTPNFSINKTWSKRAFKDIFNFWFLMPLLFSILTLITTNLPIIQIFYFIARIIAVYLIYSFISSFIKIEKLVLMLKRSRLTSFSHHLAQTLVYFQSHKKD